MVRVIGTDSGTKSYDIFGFDDESGEILVDESIPRDEMVRDPSIVVKRLKQIDNVYRIDAIVASSGYGMPLKLARDATDEEIAMATFVTENDVKRGLRILGLRKLMKMLKEDKQLNEKTYFTPGVIHLPTVPRYRKINRIDMGTSDKIYSVALAIARHAEAKNISYSSVNLITVEVGFAYTSAIAVKCGEIVDALAGTSGFPSYLGGGFIDGEIFYAVANVAEVSKEVLFRGGAAYLSNIDPFRTPIEMFIEMEDEGYRLMLESIAKDISVLMVSTEPDSIYFSGRFTRVKKFMEDLSRYLEENLFKKFRESPMIVKLESRGRIAKEAAEGAAIIASGIVGGRYRELVDVLRLRESSGTIFDYINIVDKEKLIERYSFLLY
ncbi:MAG: DUF1464 family protein [Ignisphaera sp.]|uniref:DUF1464 domain-containing protein n=1 Tax=Ignisphaera aggregans TaxID=334771 RepID=A0A7J3MY65_9CREN